MTAPVIVGIGGSSGAHEPLEAILSSLSRGFPAAVLVTLHRHVTSDSFLSMIMDKKTAMTVKPASDGETLVPATVYIAPPDRHLVVAGDQLRLTSGPRENRSRPSIDVLFRSLAVERGPRAIGVLLSGLLNDGVDGLRSIAACGGSTVVQDPNDARYREMPDHALNTLVPDFCIAADRIAGVLAEMAENSGPTGAEPFDPPPEMRAEVDMALGKRLSIATENWLGEHTNVTCPDCGGVLWQVSAESPLRYRCHTGHGFTADVLEKAEAEKVEEAMWVAMRTLRERAETLRRLAERAAPAERRHWQDRAREADAHADQVAQSLVSIASHPADP